MVILNKDSSNDWQADAKAAILIARDDESNKSDIDRYYSVTNEAIELLCDVYKENIRNGKVLSVAGSADQPLAFALYGAKHIDLFDINKMAYYILALKKAALLSLDRNEYTKLIISLTFDEKFWFNPIKTIKKAVNRIQEQEAQYFWEYLIANLSLEEMRKISKNDIGDMKWTALHSLLFKKEMYKKLKVIIEETYFSFQTADICNVEGNNYDFIYYSNIFSYLSVDLMKLTANSPIYYEGGRTKALNHTIPKINDNGVAVFQIDVYENNYQKQIPGFEFEKKEILEYLAFHKPGDYPSYVYSLRKLP